MKTFLALLSFSIVLSSLTYAQPLTQTVRGQVMDGQTKTTLPGANIILLDSTNLTGTTSDIDGKFRLEKVPLGRQRIKISFIGYKEIVMPLILTSGKEIVLNIELEESVTMGKEIIILAEKDKTKTNNEMTTVSARSFTIEETSRYAGSLNDPARMAQNYAGAVGANDQRNDIIIRGNSPSGVLFRLDGIDIPNPNHFAMFGTTGGPISMLNNNVLSNSDFMTSAFPAEYGNALSGVFDLKMRPGNNEKHEYIGQFGFNGLELGAEGPLSKAKKSSYLINYRYSTLELFKAMGISLGTSAIPHYQDMSFKLNFPNTKLGSFALFGLGGMSNIAMLDSEKDTADWSYGLNTRNDIKYGTTMGAIGLTHTYLINNSTYTKLVISSTGSTMKSDVDSIAPDNSKVPWYRNPSSTGKNSIAFFLNKKFSVQHNIKIGFFIDRLNDHYIDSGYNSSKNRFVTYRDYNGSTYLLQPYLQWKYKITDALVLNTGLHYQHFLLNNSNALEPRAGLSWNITPTQAINFGYGMHSQMQMGFVYFFQKQMQDDSYTRPNENLGFTKSQHFVIGYDENIGENIRLKAEVYYQELYNVPVDKQHSNAFSMLTQGADFNMDFVDTMVNKGTGTNYGMEITVEKFFNKDYYFLLTGSFFDSQYQGSDGIERSTPFNVNYVVNALFGGEIKVGKSEKKLKTLILDGKLTTSGGKRYTPIDLEKSKQYSYAVYQNDLAFSKQNPGYFRADVKIGFRMNSKRVTQTWGLDLQNIFGIKNILIQSYDKRTNTIREEYQLGFLPVGLYKIEF